MSQTDPAVAQILSATSQQRGIQDPSPFFQKQLPTAIPHDSILLTLPSTITQSQFNLYHTLHTSIANDDTSVIDRLQNLIESRQIDINFQHESIFNSCTFLMHACYRQNLQLVLFLLTYMPVLDINIQNIFSQETALFYAIVHCPVFTETTVHIVRELIQHDINPNTRCCTHLPVIYELMKRSCEPITDFFIDIAATLLASTTPVSMTICTHDHFFISPLRFLLTNRYQSQRTPLFKELVELLVSHRAAERVNDSSRFSPYTNPDQLRTWYRHFVPREDSPQVNFNMVRTGRSHPDWIMMAMPDCDATYQPYQTYYHAIYAFMHPQPSYAVIKYLLLETEETVQVRQMSGPNHQSVLSTLFQYIEHLDQEIVKIVHFVLKLHTKQMQKESRPYSLTKTTMGYDALIHYPQRDTLGPKLFEPIALPSLMSPTPGSSDLGGSTPQLSSSGKFPSASTSGKGSFGSFGSFGKGSTSPPSPTSLATLNDTATVFHGDYPSIFNQNKHFLNQISTLYQNLHQYQNEFNANPFQMLEKSSLYSLEMNSPIEKTGLSFFLQYPNLINTLQYLQQPHLFSPTSGHTLQNPLEFNTVQFTQSDILTLRGPASSSPHEPLSQLLRIYEHQSLVPLPTQDFNPYTISPGDSKGTTHPANGQNITTLSLIISLFSNNRWRWSKTYQDLCNLATGNSTERIYYWLHVLLLSPNPDYSILYKFAALHQASSRSGKSQPLTTIERGLLYLFSNPHVDGTDRMLSSTTVSLTSNTIAAFAGSGQSELSSNNSKSHENNASIDTDLSPAVSAHHPTAIPFLRPQVLTTGLPNALSPSAPYHTTTAFLTANQSAATPPHNHSPRHQLTQFQPIVPATVPIVSDEFAASYAAGRIAVYTHAQRLHIISRLTNPIKETEFVPADNNVLLLTQLLMKHFHARPNHTIRRDGKLMTCLSALLGNTAVSFDLACALFHKIITTSFAGPNAFVPSSVVLFWPNGEYADPAPADCPKYEHKLLPIEMAVYEAVEWMINYGKDSTSYLNFIALIYVLVKLRGVKVSDFRRQSTTWASGEKMFQMSRLSSEERNAKLNAAVGGNGRRMTTIGGAPSQPQGARRGTVVGKDGKPTKVDPKDAGKPTNRRGTIAGGPGGQRGSVIPGQNPGGHRGSVIPGQNPGGRRGTILGGAPRGVQPDENISLCDQWSLMTLLLCFGNYDAIGVFELFNYLTFLGNPMQPPTALLSDLKSGHDSFRSTYSNTTGLTEPISDVMKYIFTVRHHPLQFPNFATPLGLYVFRRMLFLMQFIVQTEEIHPNVVLFNRMAQHKRQLAIQYKNNPHAVQPTPQKASDNKSAASRPTRILRQNGNDDDDDDDDDDYYDDDYDEDDDGYYNDDGHDDDDDMHNDDQDLAGLRGNPPEASNSESAGDNAGDSLPTANTETASGHMIQSLHEISPSALLQSWVKPQLNINFFGPKYESYVERNIADKDFIFSEPFGTQILQQFISIPNSDRATQYHLLQFVFVYFHEILRPVLTSPLPYQGSAFGTPSPGPSSLSSSPSNLQASIAFMPVLAEDESSSHKSANNTPGASHRTLAEQQGEDDSCSSNSTSQGLQPLSEDQLTSLQAPPPLAQSSGGPATGQGTPTRGRTGTMAGSRNPARDRSQSRGRGPTGGARGSILATDKSNEFSFNITSLFVSGLSYNFWTILTLLFLEEHVTTHAQTPLQMSHFLPFFIDYPNDSFFLPAGHHALTVEKLRSNVPSTTYTRSPLLSLIAMSAFQPITVMYLFLLEFYLRKYYTRLQAHLSIETSRSVVIQICPQIPISPLFVFLHYSSLNRTVNHFAPTLSTSIFNNMELSGSIYSPGLQYDLDQVYVTQLHPVNPYSSTVAHNSTSNIFVKYHRQNPHLTSAAIQYGPNATNVLQPYDTTLYTAQMMNLLIQFETDYGRWIAPTDPAHIRNMIRHRPEHLQTGSRYNYKTTVSYPVNMLSYFYLKQAFFYNRHAATWTSVHTYLTQQMFQAGFCPNLTTHDDDDICDLHRYPSPLHAILNQNNMPLTYTPAVIDMTKLFLSNPNFDPEVGFYDQTPLVIAGRTRQSATTYHSKLYDLFLKHPGVNLHRMHNRDTKGPFWSSMNDNSGEFYHYTSYNATIMTQLHAAGQNSSHSLVAQDGHFVQASLPHLGSGSIRHANYSRVRFSTSWLLQMPVMFYTRYLLVPNNVAHNPVLALALHPNLTLKRLLFGIENWDSVRPIAAYRAYLATYFTNPLHFGTTQLNKKVQESQIDTQLPLSYLAATLTPGFININQELSLDFIQKYQSMSLEQFLTQRQTELAKQNITDYNIYDIIVLLDRIRGEYNISNQSWMNIAQLNRPDSFFGNFAGSELQTVARKIAKDNNVDLDNIKTGCDDRACYPREWRQCIQAYDAMGYDGYFKNGFSAPGTKDREIDQILYKGLLWYFTDNIPDMNLADLKALTSITKEKLSPSCQYLLTRLYKHCEMDIKTLIIEEVIEETKEISVKKEEEKGLPAGVTENDTLLKLIKVQFDGTIVLEHDYIGGADPITSMIDDMDIHPAHFVPFRYRPTPIESLSSSDCVIDFSSRDLFNLNLIHKLILRQWNPQTLKCAYHEVIVQMTKKHPLVHTRFNLTQPEQIELEEQLLTSPSTPSWDKKLIKSLREQHQQTQGRTPTKFQADFYSLYRDMTGYSVLQYFIMTRYEINSDYALDNLTSNKYLATYCSPHYLKYTRYIEYQQATQLKYFPTPISNNNYLLLQQQNTQLTPNGNYPLYDPSIFNTGQPSSQSATLPHGALPHMGFTRQGSLSHQQQFNTNRDSSSSFGETSLFETNHDQSSLILSLTQLPAAQRAFLDLTQNGSPKPTSIPQDDGRDFSYNFGDIPGKKLNELQNMPWLSSLMLQLTFDFNLTQPIPNHQAAAQFNPQYTSQTSLLSLFKSNLPLPIASIPYIDTHKLSQSHFFGLVWMYSLGKDFPPEYADLIMDRLSIYYTPDELAQHARALAQAQRTIAPSPRNSPLSSPSNSSGLSSTTPGSSTPTSPAASSSSPSYLHKILHGKDGPISPKPMKSPLLALPEDQNTLPRTDSMSVLLNDDVSNLTLGGKKQTSSTDNSTTLKPHKEDEGSFDQQNQDDTFLEESSSSQIPRARFGAVAENGPGKHHAEESASNFNYGHQDNFNAGSALGALPEDIRQPDQLARVGEADDEYGEHNQQKRPDAEHKFITTIATIDEDKLPEDIPDIEEPDYEKKMVELVRKMTPVQLLEQFGEDGILPSPLQNVLTRINNPSIYRVSKVEALIPPPPDGVRLGVFDYGYHTYTEAMNATPYIYFPQELPKGPRTLSRQVTQMFHNGQTHNFWAFSTQQALHQVLFRLQQHSYYASLSFNEQFGLTFTLLSDELNTPLDFTKPETLPDQPHEIHVRRLSHSGNALIFNRKHRLWDLKEKKTPHDCGDVVVKPLSMIPVSKQFLHRESFFLNSFSYQRYFTARFVFATQFTKYSRIKLTSWHRLTRALIIQECHSQNSPVRSLPHFPFAHAVIQAYHAFDACQRFLTVKEEIRDEAIKNLNKSYTDVVCTFDPTINLFYVVHPISGRYLGAVHHGEEIPERDLKTKVPEALAKSTMHLLKTTDKKDNKKDIKKDKKDPKQDTKGEPGNTPPEPGAGKGGCCSIM